jgi:hypothetical protein
MKSFALVLPLVACCSTAFAQNAVERAVSMTQSRGPAFRSTVPTAPLLRDGTEAAPELYPGEMEDVGPQFLVARERQAAAERKLFESFFDTQLFYTSNALLTDKGNQDTSVMVFTLQAAINLPQFELFGGTVSPRIGYRHQWWLYSLDDTGNQLNNFDFAVSSFFIGVQHNWGEQWVATAALDYNRFLLKDDGWHEFYTELVPNWSFEHIIPIGEAAQITLGYYGAYHFTHTDENALTSTVAHINDRLDNALGFTYTRELFSNLFLQTSYRWQWSHYTENSDRNDIYHNASAALVYVFNEWASIRGFVNYENRNSTDDDVFDYNKWDSGGGITFSARF